MVEETKKKVAPAKKSATSKTKKPIVKTVKKSAPKADTLAVIETGGKQYLVRPGEKIRIEKIEKPAKGTTITFDQILLVAKGDDVKIGTPYVSAAKIKAEWVAEKRAKKVITVKYKSKTRQSTKKGHRQIYTEVIISDF